MVRFFVVSSAMTLAVRGVSAVLATRKWNWPVKATGREGVISAAAVPINSSSARRQYSELKGNQHNNEYPSDGMKSIFHSDDI
jgi:hypothetical protein